MFVKDAIVKFSDCYYSDCASKIYIKMTFPEPSFIHSTALHKVVSNSFVLISYLGLFLIDSKIEQHVSIKFYVKFKSAAEAV